MLNLVLVLVVRFWGSWVRCQPEENGIIKSSKFYMLGCYRVALFIVANINQDSGPSSVVSEAVAYTPTQLEVQ